MLEALRGIKAWQVFVLLAVVVVVAVGGYVGYTRLTAEDAVVLEEDQRLVAVQRGDLVNSVSVNGSLVYKNRDSLSFGADGTVAEVSVEEGQRVRAGSTLARLDSETMADLERKVVQAEGALRDSEKALKDARNPYTDVNLAEADKKLADARVALKKAEDDLADLLATDEQALAKASSELASARIALRDAEDALSDLLATDGQALAKAALDVADARVALGDAEDALAKLIPDAQKAVAAAETALKEARDNLADLLEPPASAVANAENAVTAAKRNLHNAREALDKLVNPSDDVIASAEAAVTGAKQKLDEAQKAMDDLTAADSDALAKARTNLELAKAALNEAEVGRTLTGTEWDDKLKDARKAEGDAAKAYADVFTAWLGAAPVGDELEKEPSAILADWGADLEALFSVLERANSGQLFAGQGGSDDPSTRWNEGTVYNWLNFYPGAVRATCEEEEDDTPETPCITREMKNAWDSLTAARESLATKGLQAEKALSLADGVIKRSEDAAAAAEKAIADLEEPEALAVEAAQNRVQQATFALRDAESALADLLDPPALDVEEKRRRVAVMEAALATAELDLANLRPKADANEIAAARAQAALAEVGLDEAKADLADLMSGEDGVGLSAARARVDLARATLSTAEADLDKLRAGPSPVDTAASRGSVALAAANVADLEEKLADLKAGASALDVGASRKSVALAAANVADMEENLAEIQAGADPLDVSQKEADVAAAKSSLDALHEKLEKSVITAPWDGIVTGVKVEEGDNVNLGVSAIEMVDPTTVEVEGTVNEVDVLFLREGSESAITLDALPGQRLSGTVSEIGAQTTAQAGGRFDPFSPQTSAVLYPITIQAEQPLGTELPEGLTALAEVVIEEEYGVLLVPIDALFGTFEQPSVKVMTDGVLEDRRIEIGNTDDFWAVVESGVKEGETVVLETRPVDQGRQFGFGRAGRAFD